MLKFKWPLETTDLSSGEGSHLDSRHLIEIVDRNLCSRMDLSKNYSDKELKDLIDACLEDLEKRIPMIQLDRETIAAAVYNGRRRLGLIQPFLEDPAVNEIMINGTDGIFVERDGVLERCEARFHDKDKLFNLIQTMIAWVNRTVNESNPIVDARLMNGSRVHAVLPPIAINGPVITIRKFAEQPFTMERLLENGTLTPGQAVYLEEAVVGRKNILIGGGTSSGKTTFMNMLAAYIPDDQRILTIEDSAELRLTQSNVVRLETRNANTEGRGEIKMRALIKAALRMRPDRLVIGEVRDESALEMLTALCTGHEGCMSTAHANSCRDMLTRLETMALWEGHISSEAIRQMIVSGVHILVHLAREGTRRRVREICEIDGFCGGEIHLRKVG